MTYTREDLLRMEKELRGVDTSYDYKNPGKVLGYDDDFIHLENITCKVPGKSLQEHYDELWVSRQMEKDPAETIACANDLGWATQVLEAQEKFLPSMALSLNVHEVMLQHYHDCTLDSDLEEVVKEHLDQYYKPEGPNFIMQNTVVNFTEEHIINYPIKSDINAEFDINSGVNRSLLYFHENIPQEKLFYENIVSADQKTFLQKLTRLQEPEHFIQLVSNYTASPIENKYIRIKEGPLAKKGVGFLTKYGENFMIMTANPGSVQVCGYKVPK